MRVAIDLVIAEKQPGGMLFATRALLEGLRRVDRQDEYIIITSKPKDYAMLASSPNMHICSVKLHFGRAVLIQHQLLMPRVLSKLQPDVLHVPAFVAPIGWKGPLVITVHDLAFLKLPHQLSLRARIYWQYLLRESVRHAQRIIVVSEQTRKELISYWGIGAERIRVIPNALRPSLRLDSIPAESIPRMRQRYGDRYLLHVGRIVPRKNVEMLIQAFDVLASRSPDLHLVLVGGAGYGSAGVMHRIESSPHRVRIHQAGWVPEQDLGPLYAAASALVFPSSHEGFGFPTVEAMACGTPVVASKEAASFEVAGDAVLRANCSNAAALADAIDHVLTDEALRDRLIQLGRARAQFFSCEACAESMWRAYNEASLAETHEKQVYALE